MTISTFEIGTPVKIETPLGIVNGKIIQYYKKTFPNQFAVQFESANHLRTTVIMTFNKKDGNVYGISPDRGKYRIL